MRVTNLVFASLFVCSLVFANKHVDNELDPVKFGAIANDNVDDTQAFQAALDYAAQNNVKVLRIPSGTFIINALKVSKGIAIIGQENSVLKKKPFAGKWSRMITFNRDDSNLAAVYKVSNITFDGNSSKQGPFLNYQLQQQHLIFMEGKNNRPEKVNVEVADCNFRNSVADAISIYTNSNAKVARCTFKDIFRGAVVVTGGNTKVEVRGITVEKGAINTGIDIEAQGKGFDGTKSVQALFKDVVLQGKFDIGLVDNSVFVGENIVCFNSPFNVMADGTSKVNIISSKFYTNQGQLRRISFPANVQFDDCDFTFRGNARLSNEKNYIIKVLLESKTRKKTDQQLTFNNCRFGTTGKVSDGIAVLLEADNAANNNLVAFNNCSIDQTLMQGIRMTSGGNLSYSGGVVACKVPFFLSSTLQNTYKVKLNGIEAKPGVSTFISVGGTHLDAISFEKLNLNYEVSKVTFRKGTGNVKINGERRILFKGSKPTRKDIPTDFFIRSEK